jgi:hypothetical protein
MSLSISFELTDRDLQFFRRALRQSREAVKDAEDTEIIEAVRAVLDEIRDSEPLPDFVGKRIPELESLLSMLTDEEWQLRSRAPAGNFCLFRGPRRYSS